MNDLNITPSTSSKRRLLLNSEMKESLLLEENRIKDTLTQSRERYYGIIPCNELPMPVIAAKLYVKNHLEAGHCGICYAWLDTAFCPLQQMFGKCPYAHSYPESWSSSKQTKHSKKSEYLKKQGKYFFPQINDKENTAQGSMNDQTIEDFSDSFIHLKKRKLFPGIMDESITINTSCKSIPVVT